MLNVDEAKKRLVSQAKSGLSITVISVLIIALSFILTDPSSNQLGLWIGSVLCGFGITVFVLANRKLNRICRK